MDAVKSFIFATAGEILFGRGVADQIGAVVQPLGGRVLVCTDRVLEEIGVVERIERALRSAGLDLRTFDGGEPELGYGVVGRCVDEARRWRPEVIVGLGGGSNIDLAKTTALLLTHGGAPEDYFGESKVPGPVLPVVAVPTTAGTGSEVTPVAVLTAPDGEAKVGVSSRHLLPRRAVIDPVLTLSCPPRLTAQTGLDALSHAVEAYLAASYLERSAPAPGQVFIGKNPVSDALALRAVELIGCCLEAAYRDGSDLAAREGMQLASLLAGMAFASAGTGTAHALQYPIGACTKTPHGLGIALLLPAAMRLVAPARRCELADIARALAVPADGRGEAELAAAAADRVAELGRAVGMPSGLRAIGVAEADLTRIARAALKIERLIRNVPVAVDEAALVGVLRDALR